MYSWIHIKKFMLERGLGFKGINKNNFFNVSTQGSIYVQIESLSK
jgi:hypothetical protein